MQSTGPGLYGGRFPSVGKTRWDGEERKKDPLTGSCNPGMPPSVCASR